MFNHHALKVLLPSLLVAIGGWVVLCVYQKITHAGASAHHLGPLLSGAVKDAEASYEAHGSTRLRLAATASGYFNAIRQIYSDEDIQKHMSPSEATQFFNSAIVAALDAENKNKTTRDPRVSSM